MDKQTNSDEIRQVEIMIGRILQIGVYVSGAVMLLGLLLFLVTGQSGYGTAAAPTSVHAILAGIITFKPYAIMMLGLFLLILTPVLRVVVSIYAFYREHDTMYVVITTVVLIILMVSFIIGIHGA